VRSRTHKVDGVTELRTSPRQRRSQESVNAILDAAEALIQEQGQISFTAGELAERAEMSVGRIYYWFNDIPAVVTALAERLRLQLADRVASLRSVAVDTPTPEVVHQMTAALCDHVDVHPALITICFIAGEHDYGAVLRSDMSGVSRRLAAARIVDVTEEELDVIAMAVSGLQMGVLRQYITAPQELRSKLRDELANMLIAWVSARFPLPEDPVWNQVDSPVRPARVHRYTRPMSPSDYMR